LNCALCFLQVERKLCSRLSLLLTRTLSLFFSADPVVFSNFVLSLPPELTSQQPEYAPAPASQPSLPPPSSNRPSTSKKSKKRLKSPFSQSTESTEKPNSSSQSFKNQQKKSKPAARKPSKSPTPAAAAREPLRASHPNSPVRSKDNHPHAVEEVIQDPPQSSVASSQKATKKRRAGATSQDEANNYSESTKPKKAPRGEGKKKQADKDNSGGTSKLSGKTKDERKRKPVAVQGARDQPAAKKSRKEKRRKIPEDEQQQPDNTTFDLGITVGDDDALPLADIPRSIEGDVDNNKGSIEGLEKLGSSAAKLNAVDVAWSALKKLVIESECVRAFGYRDLRVESLIQISFTQLSSSPTIIAWSFLSQGILRFSIPLFVVRFG
jgi:hypothetical protein